MQSAQILQKENNLLKKKLEQNAVYIKSLEATLIDFKKNRQI